MTRRSPRFGSHLNRLVVAILAVVLVPLALSAQHLSLAAGYSEMSGSIGDGQSDHGILVRLGGDLRTGARLSWALEGAVERLNEARSAFSSSCIVPGGGTSTCHFARRSRDTGWSFGTSLRLTGAGASVRPYALLGLGLLSVRTWEQQVVTDDDGTTLPNFSYEGTSRDEALQGHLGAGLSARPRTWRVGLFVEGRMTRLFHSYSGGLVADWNPTVVVGVRR